mmetsp:Transcript_109859/g.309838  ORF Transcript_109859/g.309838 Transcript_109859/m.309838 type:complete len:237 (+) Transcript_109859:119-829(+)
MYYWGPSTVSFEPYNAPSMTLSTGNRDGAHFLKKSSWQQPVTLRARQTRSLLPPLERGGSNAECSDNVRQRPAPQKSAMMEDLGGVAPRGGAQSTILRSAGSAVVLGRPASRSSPSPGRIRPSISAPQLGVANHLQQAACVENIRPVSRGFLQRSASRAGQLSGKLLAAIPAELTESASVPVQELKSTLRKEPANPSEITVDVALRRIKPGETLMLIDSDVSEYEDSDMESEDGYV